MKEELEGFDSHAEEYDEILEHALAFAGGDSRYYAERKIGALAEFFRSPDFPSPAKILEFGCGTGNNLPLLRDRFPAAEVHGIDVSVNSLEVARRLNVDRCHLHGYAGGNLLGLDHRFDLVIAANVFHHIEPHARLTAMTAIHKVLAPQGVVVVIEHNPFNPLTRKVVRDCPFDEGVVLLKPSDTEALFRTAGLEVLQKRYIVFLPATVSFLNGIERYLSAVPAGAQYCVFARNLDPS